MVNARGALGVSSPGDETFTGPEPAQAANEAVWQLPLDDTHFKQIESDYADIKNSGAGSPGASVGAAFIGSFIEEAQVWVHLDIAGVDLLDKARPAVQI